MTIKHTLKLLLLLLIFSCNSDYHLSKIKGERLDIDENLKSDSTIEEFIKPYRESVNRNMDSVISYAPNSYAKNDTEYNTAIGNLMADAVFEESDPIFYSRTGNHIDFVLLNHGGIRAAISKGDIKIRTAFEIMPFENSVVVVALKGKQLILMSDFLASGGRAHPLSKQFELIINEDSSVKSSTINGEKIDPNKTYYVATNDYLYNGGNRMTFFHPNDSLYVLDYKIRSVMIDYFKKRDTINPKHDGRFIMQTN